MVKIKKQSSVEWMLWDTRDEKHSTVVAVHIHKCEDMFMGKRSTFYRVDKAGATFDTLLRTKREAVDAAKVALNYGRKEAGQC